MPEKAAPSRPAGAGCAPPANGQTPDQRLCVGEGFNEIITAEMDNDWIVVPRRLRLEPESWTIAEPEKPPHDYHYLSFPDNPDDFGGPGLNGRPWVERTKARADVLLDDEMSSQG